MGPRNTGTQFSETLEELFQRTPPDEEEDEREEEEEHDA